MTSERRYFGDNLSIQSIVGASGGSYGATGLDIGLLQGCEVWAETKDVEIDACGSGKRQDIAQTELRVHVKFDYGAFDANLLAAALGYTNWTNATGVFTGWLDTPIKPLFNVTGRITDHNDTKRFDVVVHNVAFSKVPLFNAKKKEWMLLNSEGIGDDVTWLEAI